MTHSGKFGLSFFLFFTSFLVFGQKSDQNTYLINTLRELEQVFSCSFSYADKDLFGQMVQLDSVGSLNEAIDKLHKYTIFDFKPLSDRNFAVSIKESAIIRCMKLVGESQGRSGVYTVRSPYQLLNLQEGDEIIVYGLSELDSLHITGEGIEPLTLPIGNLNTARCTTVNVFSSIEYLEAVTLTNYLARGITKNRTGSLMVNYDEFDILPGLIEPDVLLTIQALPGIQSVNETVSFLNIRGGTNDQNLILWDGIKMYQSGHFFGQISAFNPFLTKKAELIRNGSSAYYGDGVSGVISMQGDDRVKDQISGGIGLNLISGDAFLTLPLGSKASLQVAGRRSYNSLVETPTYDAYFEKAFQNTEVVSNNDIVSASDDDFAFFDAHLRLVYQASKKDLIRANFLALGNNLDFLENAELENQTRSRQSELSQNNLSAGLYYRRQWSDKVLTELLAYGSAYGLKALNADIPNNQRLKQENDILESGVKVNGSYRTNQNLQINAGAQFNETGVTNFEQLNDPFFERTDKQVLRTTSLFSEAVWKPKGLDAQLTAGIRANYISKIDEFLVEPRLNFNLRFLKYFSFDLAAELKSQSTSQVIDLQNDFLGIENRRWVVANGVDIPILRSRQISAGINFSKRSWLINVEPYLKEINGITTQSQGFQNQFENVRTHGNYMVKGIDILFNKKLKDFTTWLGYSYAENNYDFSELEPSGFPNNIDVRHTLSYGLNYSIGDFDLSAGLNWHTGKPVTNLVPGLEVMDRELNFQSPNSDNIDDYIRIDLSATYRFVLSKGLEAFTGISFWNLFNSNNEINRFYRLNDENLPESVVERSLQLTPNATFRINF